MFTLTSHAFGICTDTEIDILGNGAQCETTHFSITTTSDTSNFVFNMSAAGTFYVDWGDGVVETIDRTDNTTTTKYSHAYSSSGTYTIKFAGTATAYNTGTNNAAAAISFYTSSGGTQEKISSISGSLGAIFPTLGTAANQKPRFIQAFAGASNLETVPSDLFSGITTAGEYMFMGLFQNCKKLTSVPEDLFANLAKGKAAHLFRTTFKGSGLTSIPAKLFQQVSGAAANMFHQTFYGTPITAIPATLFSGVSGAAENMFSATFRECTSLESLPDKLFAKISGAASNMFYQTFYGCDGLTGYIPKDMFEKLNLTDVASSTMSQIFANTTLLTSCPSGTAQFATMMESLWNKHVACTTKYFLVQTIKNTKEFSLKMSVKGTMFVDWGDGKVSAWPRATTTEETLSHTYSTSGQYSIKIYGDVEEYNTGSVAAITFQPSASKISSIDGSLTSVFPALGNAAKQKPKFIATFKGATELKELPITLFSGYGIPTPNTSLFESTFANCTSLESIPDMLFINVNGSAEAMYKYTFQGCTSLTQLPHGLFAGSTVAKKELFKGTFYGCSGLESVPNGVFFIQGAGADSLFHTTFKNCTGLTSIASGLFNNITTGATMMFGYTFQGCTKLKSIPGVLWANVGTSADSMFIGTFYGDKSLTQIPSNLFSNITADANKLFQQTFMGCTNLSGYIPKNTFAGLISHNSPTNSTMWVNTFTNTALATNCSQFYNTVQYNTGYEGTETGSTWNGKVSCELCDGIAYKEVCHPLCPTMTILHVGDLEYPILADRINVASPVIHLSKDDRICYVYLEPDTGNETGLKINYNNTVYYAIDPR